jgi:hypothetical protein
MYTIYKYEAPIEEKIITITLPQRAKILQVGEQYGELYFWALIDTKPTEHECRIFEIIGTGHELKDFDTAHYIGTVQMKSGLVWHVFERITSLIFKEETQE